MSFIKIFMGPMFSEKSAHLLKNLMQTASKYLFIENNKVLFITPIIDNRGFFTRHRETEDKFNNMKKILPIIHVEVSNFNEMIDFIKNNKNIIKNVFIDEFHLFKNIGCEQFIKFCINNNINIICSGLNGCSNQKMFKNVNILLPFATKIKLLNAECRNKHCKSNKNAFYSKWVSKHKKGSIISIGDTEYAAVCPSCLYSEKYD